MTNSAGDCLVRCLHLCLRSPVDKTHRCWVAPSQLYVGERPWAGLRPVQIILKKTSGRANLAFPPGTPAAYKVQAAGKPSDWHGS